MMRIISVFFFSSRRRHTRFDCDWSSDVCSSDLRRDEGVTGIEKVMGTKPRAFRNNEEMYAAHATDAVVISTADFQHAYHGVEAMQAGEGAYIAKPPAPPVEGARASLGAGVKTGPGVANRTP